MVTVHQQMNELLWSHRTRNQQQLLPTASHCAQETVNMSRMQPKAATHAMGVQDAIVREIMYGSM